MPYRPLDNGTKRLIVRLRRFKSAAEIQYLTGIDERTVQRVVRLHNLTGDVTRTSIMRGRPRRLSGFEVSFLEGCVHRQPDITIDELQELLFRVCSVEISASTVERSLRRRGLTYKKVSRHAAERDEVDRARFQWIIGMFYRADQLVCVDESACDRRTPRRRYAWSYSGERALVRDSFSRGGKYSILPAVSLDGVLHCVIHEGSFTTARFNDFVRGLLDEMNPFPEKNSVILMDNASIHKSAELREMVESRGMRLLFIPAYSPDMNPIEEAFSAIKAFLRRHQATALRQLLGGPNTEPIDFLLQAVYSITPSQVRGWYQYSNYVM